MRFLLSTCLLAFVSSYGSAHQDAVFYEPTETSDASPVTYLSWDNTTPASEIELSSDPLLIIRTIPRESYNDHQTVGHLASANKKSDRKRASKIIIVNLENHFEFTRPLFGLHALFECTKIHWQVSKDPEFATIIPSLDKIADYDGTVKFTDLENTFLDNDTVYYFRVKCTEGFVSNNWSAPFTFTLTKPNVVQNLRIVENDAAAPSLVWDANENPHASYCIYGSVTPDFVPTTSSSSDRNPDEVDNFLGETETNCFVIDEQLGYYRVVTKINDSLSIPSSLIKFEGAFQFDNINSEEGIDTENFPDHRLSLNSYAHKAVNYAPYAAPTSLPLNIRDELTPYFLPENSPQRVILDQIFSKRRVLSSLKSMSRAGFILLTDPRHKIIVARHPKIPGYLFKIFLDSSSECEYYWWRKRINGINTIQAAIESHGYGNILKTPKKWMYPLPPDPTAAEGSYPKHFILVVEEMDILKHTENRSAYRKLMTKERLNAFYTLLTELKLIDSVYADNTPFCKDSKMAFIDTEHAMDVTQPVPLSVVGQYLEPEMLGYWEQLITRGIPQ